MWPAARPYTFGGYSFVNIAMRIAAPRLPHRRFDRQITLPPCQCLDDPTGLLRKRLATAGAARRHSWGGSPRRTNSAPATVMRPYRCMASGMPPVRRAATDKLVAATARIG